MISDEAMVAALRLRRIAWATMGTTPLALKDMGEAKREEIERASANFRDANKTLLEGVTERKGRWAHGGLTLYLDVHGDRIIWSEPVPNDVHGRKMHLNTIRKAEEANERRFKRQKATA
jgi:hypothetical protein